MKTKYIILFVIANLLFIPSWTNAQLIKIGAGGGITQILAPDSYKNNVGEDGGYGFTTEWNAGAIVKVDLPLLPITPRGFLFYHSLSGSGELDPTLYEEPSVEYTQPILEIGLGAQYNFIPTPLGFDPYIALDLSFNSFGKLEGNDIEVPNTEINRFGGGIGLGTEVTIIPLINLDFYLSYKMFNLTGKEDGEETITAVTLDAFIIFNFL